ncbi:MAG: cell division protein FtsZ [Alphaproteobacteria bacterium]
MTLNITMTRPIQDLKPRIVVVGVGGAGGNAVENMIQSELEGVEFLVCNTDAQALALSAAAKKIQLGLTVTQGLGAGSRPDIGRAAAEEGIDEIIEHLQGANMVFITAGMGGGTGTGAGPVIARAAREMGVLTVGVVTKPFHFEGQHRMNVAEAGIEELTQYVDTLIIIPNQNLFRVANEKTTFADAFKMADDVLYSGVRGVTDLMVMPGLINLDFADIRTVMAEMGKAMMGTGEASGERRALEAAEAAISNPLLEDITMKGAKGVLINITGGLDMTLFEVDEAANRIRDEVDPEANIIFGSTFDENLEGQMRVSVVATGIDVAHMVMPKPAGQPILVADSGRRLQRMAGEGGVSAAAPTAAPIMAPAPKSSPSAKSAVATTEIEIEVAAPQVQAPAQVQAPVQAQAPAMDDAPAARPTALATEAPAEDKVQVSVPPPTATNPAPRPAFIPPRPVEPGNRRVPEAGTANPFTTADLVNAGPASEKPRRGGLSSLFNRATGGAERKAASAPKAPVSPVQQPRLEGMDPKDRIKMSEPEDDLLEIPAFLRRQAN